MKNKIGDKNKKYARALRVCEKARPFGGATATAKSGFCKGIQEGFSRGKQGAKLSVPRIMLKN